MTPSRTATRMEMPVSRMKTPVSKMEMPVSMMETFRMDIPVLTMEMPICRMEMPVSWVDTPVSKMDIPVSRMEMPVSRNGTEKSMTSARSGVICNAEIAMSASPSRMLLTSPFHRPSCCSRVMDIKSDQHSVSRFRAAR